MFFFFSSRRRHTRWTGDWSSDVCSSDLPDPRGMVVVAHGFGEHGACYDHVARAVGTAAGVDFVAADFRGHGRSPGRRGVVRSEERRVGKECRFRWSPDDQKEKNKAQVCM